MTGKERAGFRAQANGLECILTVGKEGVTEAVAASALEAILPRELIKGGASESCPSDARECAQILAEKIEAEIIQVTGRKFVLYKYNPELHKQKKAPSTGHVYGRHKIKNENGTIRRGV